MPVINWVHFRDSGNLLARLVVGNDGCFSVQTLAEVFCLTHWGVVKVKTSAGGTHSIDFAPGVPCLYKVELLQQQTGRSGTRDQCFELVPMPKTTSARLSH